MADPLIYAHPFVAGEQSWCVWDYDMRKHDLAFLDGVDSSYFEHFANVHSDLLETEEKYYAATALRSAYMHGLESLFALICATLQAHDCISAWMLKYRVSDMEWTVRRISQSEPILHRRLVVPLTWNNIANTFCSFPRENEEKEKLVKAAFGRLWRRFAEDVTDESQIAEYNSIKHGLRVQAGGVEVAIGAEDVPGVPAPAENMRVLGTSDFGNTFYIAQKLHPKDFRIERQSINWCPMKFVYGLQLIAMSINNVVSFAKILKGVERNSVSFQCPIDQTLFEMPWKKGPEVTRVNLNSIIEKAMVDPTTAQEIKDSYI